jgi:hypothetical protein
MYGFYLLVFNVTHWTTVDSQKLATPVDSPPSSSQTFSPVVRRKTSCVTLSCHKQAAE